ncbi:MAG: VWA domain-containing protein [Luteolibacter sp.]
MLTLANPYGLLALLGIPAVLAIHFLQRKAVELPVSTLFLLERTQRDAASGRRLDRIIPSVPLWMQLLAVLLLTWFLSEPRFQKSGSVQRIAIVLDSSASMGVFKKEALARLSEALPTLQGPASTVELTVMESAPGRPRLYAGSSVDELKAALEKWQPLDGLNDPSQSLRLARSLVSREGTVIYLTDTPAESLPFDAKLIAVGDPVENVGFTGVTFATEEGSLVWRALVRNYGKSDADRTWSVKTSTGSTEPRPLHLAAGALVTLQSAFPKDAENVCLTLSSDRFPLDDTLPIVAPAPKTLALFTATSPAFAGLTTKLLRSLDAAIPTNDAASADLSISSYDPLDPVLPPGNSIIFVEDSTRTGAYLKGGILAEPSPLLDGLNWQSLLVRETIQLDRLPTDTVLLWQEKRPLIFLREREGKRQLCFNFDLRLSNADKQPAFIVLLHRFAESVRAAKIAPTSANLETGQPIRITSAPNIPLKVTATDLAGKPVTVAPDSNAAPLLPCFLTVQQNDTKLLNAAVFFADTREADFSACGSASTMESANKSTIERHTRPDPFWRGWILLLLAALLVSWKFSAGKELPA